MWKKIRRKINDMYWHIKFKVKYMFKKEKEMEGDPFIYD